MTTITDPYIHQHPTPARAWVTETESGVTSGRYHWTTHLGAPVQLVTPGPLVDLVAEARLFEFTEDREPAQIFLRLVGKDVDAEDADLTAAEADTFIAAAEQWIAGLRQLRAQMNTTDG